MILHFVIDGKLIDQIIDNFLEVSDQNHFLVFGVKEGEQHFSRITRTGDFISVYNEEKDDINIIIKRINAKAIILHSLTYSFAKAVLKINQKVPICWYAWGFDVYNLSKINSSIFAPKTNWFLIKSNPGVLIERGVLRNDSLRSFYFEKVKQKSDPIRTVSEAIKKIAFFSTFVEEDFNIFSSYYPSNLKFVNSTFSTIDQYLAGGKDFTTSLNSGNILLGNSYSASSNYLDAIYFLSQHLYKIKKVYVVLSYGTDENYKNKVLTYGSKMLGSHFHPLTDFLSRDEYLRILQSCSVGLFYHYRQQAMGNIIALLYMGSRVYLSEKNPAYDFFIRNGIEINCVEKEYDKYGCSNLETQSINNNRKQLDKLFTKEKVISDLKSLTRVLLEYK